MFLQDLNEYAEYIGPFIKALRYSIDMTQRELSEESGYSIQTVSKIENGRITPNTYAGKEIFQLMCKKADEHDIDVVRFFDDFCESMACSDKEIPQMLQ